METEKNSEFDWVEDHKPTIYFDDLVFNPHPVLSKFQPDAVQATGHFPINGKWYSVVGGGSLYGDGIGTFEVWCDGMEEPSGWLSKEEVNNLLLKTQYE
jgi:hypothetical protein